MSFLFFFNFFVTCVVWQLLKSGLCSECSENTFAFPVSSIKSLQAAPVHLFLLSVCLFIYVSVTSVIIHRRKKIGVASPENG